MDKNAVDLLIRTSCASVATMSKQLNPFYIEQGTAGHNGEDDDWADTFDDENNNNHEGWGDDDEDLEELLDQEGQQPRRSKGGYLPVRNLTASQQQQQHDSDTRWRRNSYCCLLLVAAVVAAFLHAKNRTTFTNDPQQHGTNGDNDQPVQRIAILGERNSGLEWLETRLKRCYPDHVTVSSSLFRSGYFFQDKPAKAQQPKTIVVAVFLNPYDWVELMRLKPQFMPHHTNIQSWNSFLTLPWTTERPPSDEAFASTGKKVRVCQHNFFYHQVVSCAPPSPDSNTSTYNNHPIYELRRDDSGESYSSILKLRGDKIRNFVQEVAKYDFVGKVFKVHYESLVEDTVNATGQSTGMPGLWSVLEEILKYSDSLDPLCDLKGPGKKDFFAPAMGNHDTMNSEFVDFMNDHVDWVAEKLVGYQPWDADRIPLSPVNYYNETVPSQSHNSNDGDTDEATTDDTAGSGTSGPSETSPGAPSSSDKTPTAPASAPAGDDDDSSATTVVPSASGMSPVGPTVTTTKPVQPSPAPTVIATKGPVATIAPKPDPTALPSISIQKTETPTHKPSNPPSQNDPTSKDSVKPSMPVKSVSTAEPSITPITAPSTKDDNQGGNPNKGSDSPSLAPSKETSSKKVNAPSAAPATDDDTTASAPSP